jgi:hypothetical protein
MVEMLDHDDDHDDHHHDENEDDANEEDERDGDGSGSDNKKDKKKKEHNNKAMTTIVSCSPFNVCYCFILVFWKLPRVMRSPTNPVPRRKLLYEYECCNRQHYDDDNSTATTTMSMSMPSKDTIQLADLAHALYTLPANLLQSNNSNSNNNNSKTTTTTRQVDLENATLVFQPVEVCCCKMMMTMMIALSMMTARKDP